MNILDYHDRSKHRPRRYAPGPGYLDWANQPDPFRVFHGAPRVDLPLLADGLATRFDDVRAAVLPAAAAPTRDSIAILLELSLGLSAWKQFGDSRWALRCNPSSGNLHPTEAYLVMPDLPDLAPGIHHYVSRDHCLERRAAPTATAWNVAFAGSGFGVALSSIHWREAWKYGMRAYRYCQHDCGHAIAAIAYAAAALGWQTRLPDAIGDDALASVLGLNRDADFHDAERETPDCLLWIGAPDFAPDADGLPGALAGATWQGHANPLSPEHRDWADIDRANAACRKPPTAVVAGKGYPARPALNAAGSGLAAARIFRQRRSALDFDGRTAMEAAAFFGMLDATLPRAGTPPWNAWPAGVHVHLALFVHRVRDVEPGLYMLLRDDGDRGELRAAMREQWLWRKIGPAHLPLYLLLPYDLRAVAKQASCHQDIAGDSCFSLGMLARMTDLAAAPWLYRRRYWECGIVGQTLYLEAETAGLRATGIGCFFDDEVHTLLGLRNGDWQSLYHFTVGAPVDDPRLTTLPPYGNRGDMQT